MFIFFFFLLDWIQNRVKLFETKYFFFLYFSVTPRACERFHVFRYCFKFCFDLLTTHSLKHLKLLTFSIANSKQQSVIQQLHARKGRLIVICSKGDATSVCPGDSCPVIEVPQVEDCLQPVVNIVPLQVFLCILRISFYLSSFFGAKFTLNLAILEHVDTKQVLDYKDKTDY